MIQWVYLLKKGILVKKQFRKMTVILMVVAMLSWMAAPVLAIANVSIVVTESTFSPNGDGFRDTTEIHWNQNEAGNVIVRVLQNGNEVTRLGTWSNMPAGPHAFVWAGTTRYNGGSRLSNGRYTVQILVTNASGTGSAATDLIVNSSLIGPGGIENWAITSDKIAPGAIKGYHLFQDGLVIPNLNADTVDGVHGTVITQNTADIGTNAAAIATNAAAIAANAANIATNAANIATNVANIATNATDIATNQGGIATNAADIAANDTSISVNAADIATNSGRITTNQNGITSLDGRVTTNENNIVLRATIAAMNIADGLLNSKITTNINDIAANDTSISVNAADIATNQADIATNVADIATNAADVATNVANIAANTGGVAGNAGLIAANAGVIAANTGAIAGNAGLIAANTGAIAGNAGLIAANAGAIATNIANIAANTANITALQTDKLNSSLLGSNVKIVSGETTISTGGPSLSEATATISMSGFSTSPFIMVSTADMSDATARIQNVRAKATSSSSGLLTIFVEANGAGSGVATIRWIAIGN